GEAGGGAVAAPPAEMRRARREGAVEVEGSDRPARTLPGFLAAGDQDDRPVVALDEPRRNDTDHALVPLRVREDVAVTSLLRLRPLVDLCDRRAQDPLLHGLPLAVHLLEPQREAPRLVRIAREQQR